MLFRSASVAKVEVDDEKKEDVSGTAAASPDSSGNVTGDGGNTDPLSGENETENNPE